MAGAVAVSSLLVVCGARTGARGQSARAPDGRARAGAALAHWAPVAELQYVVDLSAQRRSGDVIALSTPPPAVQSRGRQDAGLWSLGLDRRLTPFAQSDAVPPLSDEPYMVMSSGSRRGCSFGDETLYVLRVVAPTGVTAIGTHGRVRRFATITAPGFESGITLDETGRFGYRLLVTVNAGIRSALYGVNCHGKVIRLVAQMQKVEGGIAVAPAGFGRFGGDLVGADEFSGHVYGFPPNGRGETLTTLDSAGTDIGVESVGFVPAGFGPGWSALVADRQQPEHPPPGDGAIMAISGSRLTAMGVKPGDLLVVTEAGAHTYSVRCRNVCHAWHVADGPPTAHVEGHVVFIAHRQERRADSGR